MVVGQRIDAATDRNAQTARMSALGPRDYLRAEALDRVRIGDPG
jgi:hypothetical protein